MRTRSRNGAIAALAALTLVAAACGDDDNASPAMTAAPEAPASTAPADTAPMSTDTADAAMAPNGPACSSVPTEGEGSFTGMATTRLPPPPPTTRSSRRW